VNSSRINEEMESTIERWWVELHALFCLRIDVDEKRFASFCDFRDGAFKVEGLHQPIHQSVTLPIRKSSLDIPLTRQS